MAVGPAFNYRYHLFMEDRKISWCVNCLNMSTRPRISFDERGWCNACQWMEEKKTLDWSSRHKELTELLDKYRSTSGGFDCIVPVSGGKDGSYVAHTLKTKYGMNPLAITVRPALALPIGNQNLLNFIQSGYNHIHISANPKVLDRLNKYGFIEKGFPYYGWLIAIMTAVINTASSLEKIKQDGDISDADLLFFKFPSDKEVSEGNLSFTHWSYFEPWDSYRNYIVAKEHCGLMEKEQGNHDTFTNFSQNDQVLYALHAYLMYLKFGFGRATQDAGIEIRRGSMTRDQALNLVRMYDNAYPEELIPINLEYYQMTKAEFDEVLDKYANKDLFEKIDGRWQPKFTTGVDFEI